MRRPQKAINTDLNAGFLQIGDRLGDALLQFVFDGRGAQHLQIALDVVVDG